MHLPEASNITSKSIYLNSIAMRKEHHNKDIGPSWVRYSDEGIDVGHDICVMDALYPLTEADGWRSFDSIRNDSRFADYVARVKSIFKIDI